MSLLTAVRDDVAAAVGKLRWVWRLAVLVPLGLYILSGLYVIRPGEVGVVRRFGRVIGPAVRPGLHYRLPWPVDKMDRVSLAVRRMPIGFKFIDREAGIAPSSWEAQFLTGDANIIVMRMIVQYAVRDPVRYLFGVEEAQWLVRKAAEAVLAGKVAGMRVDDVLTTARDEIQVEVRDELQRTLSETGTGLQVMGATLQDVAAPEEVAPAFRDVASAREDKQRRINEAYGNENDLIPRARGERDKMIASAEAERDARAREARGEAERFRSLLAEYRKAPAITAERMYLEAMEEILRETKVYITGGDDRASPLRLRLIEGQ